MKPSVVWTTIHAGRRTQSRLAFPDGPWVFQGRDDKAADRDTLLARMRDHIHNDFNLEKPAMRAGVIKLVKDLQARKLRIDGIGNQAHWRLDTPTVDAVVDVLRNAR